jgi:hypothetical protein
MTLFAKLFQNPLNYEEVLDRTQYKPFNRLLIFDLEIDLDIDLGCRDAGFVHDTSSYYSDYLCQVFSKSFDI